MKKLPNTLSTLRALQDVLIEADSESLTAAVEAAGLDAGELVRRGRAAAQQAIARVSNGEPSAAVVFPQSHEALGVFLQMLRRRDKLSEQQLADRAQIEVAEVRRIEYDPTYNPRPRTIYKLEQTFELPSRSLVRLAGMKSDPSPGFEERALRFAASAKHMDKLTREETKMLNEFVRFLASDARSSEDE